MNLVAVDTETTPFIEPKYGYKTRITPFVHPELVIGSFYPAARAGAAEAPEASGLPRDRGAGPSDEASVLPAARAVEEFERLLRSDAHLVFHNVAFDVFVFLRRAPHLLPLVIAATDAGRFHDTRIMEVLIQIARGSRTVTQRELVLYPTLEKLAFKRANMTLSKDPTVRLGFGAYLGKEDLIPPSFLAYAKKDVEATWKVFQSQQAEARIYASADYAPGPLLPDVTNRFGLLTETIQIKAALAFTWLEGHPVRVDLPHLDRIKSRLATEASRFQEALISYGWATKGPKTGKFHFQSKKIRAILESYARHLSLPLPRTLTGLLSLRHDDWSPHLPKITQELHSNPFVLPPLPAPGRAKRKRKKPTASCEAAAPAPAVDPPPEPDWDKIGQALSVWLRYMRVQKLLATYIWPYSSSERHYPQYSIIGARSTRTSCRAPNIQNTPKRKDGIRAAFIPEAGQVLVERDYDSAELRGLAQVYHGLFGASVLGDALNSGTSPHDQTARWLDESYDSLPQTDRTRLRQAAKAVNFGLPGGLGARTLAKYAATAWGVRLTEEEARAARQTALSRDPQLRTYLAERWDDLALARLAARNCGCTWQQLVSALSAWTGHPGEECHPNWLQFRRRLVAWKNGTFSPEGLNVPPGFDPRFDLTKSHCRTPTGFVRGNCTYTQSHNTPFQSIVASGAKLGLWELFKSWARQFPGVGPNFSPVAFIHDSIVVQCLQSAAADVDALLDAAMVKGMSEVCPNIKILTTSSGPLSRWGPDTNPWGDEVSSSLSPPSPQPVLAAS